MSDNNVNRRTILKSAGAAGLAGLAGCSGGGGDKSGDGGDGGQKTTTTSKSQSKGPIKIGTLAPLSGVFAADGRNVVQGNKLAIQQINESGGINGREVENHTIDTGTNPKKAVTEVKSLINQEDVSLLSGAVSSSVGLAVTSLAEKHKIPYMGGVGAAAGTGKKCSPYLFINNPSVEMVARGGFRYLKQNTDMQSAYLIVPDYSWGHSIAKAQKEWLQNNGIEFKGQVLAEFLTTDFSGQITKAMNSGADTLVINLWAQDQIKFMNQIIQFDPYDTFDRINIPWSNIDFAKGMQPKAVEGVIAGGPYYWNVDNKRNKQFVSAFEGSFGRKPPVTAYIQYSGTRELLRSAKEAGTADGPKVAAKMEGRTYKAPKGGDGEHRACDHQNIEDWFITKGRAEGDRTHKLDFFKHIETVKGKDIVQECRQSCDAPFFD